MRIFLCCALSVYTGIFFNTIINWCDWYFKSLGCIDGIEYRFEFSFTLLCGLIISVCSYLSSILREIKLKESPHLKELIEDEIENQIIILLVLFWVSVIAGLLIDIFYPTKPEDLGSLVYTLLTIGVVFRFVFLKFCEREGRAYTEEDRDNWNKKKRKIAKLRRQISIYTKGLLKALFLALRRLLSRIA